MSPATQGPPPGLLASVCGEMVPTGFALTLLRLREELPVGSRVLVVTMGYGVANKRNMATMAFLETPGLEWLMFVERLPPPWFQGEGIAGGEEDFRFCLNARAAGFRIGIDADCVALHHFQIGLSRVTRDALLTTPDGRAALAALAAREGRR